MKCSIIGIGHIGEIILNCLVDNSNNDISISNRTFSKIKSYIGKFKNLYVYESNCEAVKNSDIVFLCVKPYQIQDVIKEIESVLKEKSTIVSVAAGLTISQMKSVTTKEFNFVRLLPNTPSEIGLGTTLVSYDLKRDFTVVDLLTKMGTFYEIKEEMMDLGSTTCGSLPAYVYAMINAYINSAVENGMNFNLAKELVTSTFIGASTMYSKSNLSGDELISNVCSKGGSTIEGINSLNKDGFDEIIRNCFDACLKRTKELGKQ